MHAVGIEGGESDFRRIFGVQVEYHFSIQVPHDQLAATMSRGHNDHQGREHAGDLFGVPVTEEEAAGVIDEKLVEVRLDRLLHAKAASCVGYEFGQRRLPTTPADLNPARIDLPGSSHVAIEHRFLAASMGCRLGYGDQSLSLRLRKRESDPAYTLHVDRRHEDFPQAADAEVTGALDRAQAIKQGGGKQRIEKQHEAGRRRSTT